MLTRAVIIITCVLAWAPSARAQSATPPRRAHHSLVYDEAAKQVLLTGGSTPVDGGRTFTFFNDTWIFDGASWKALGESGQKLSGAKLAFDTRRNRVVSFGGYTGASMPDLRRFDGTNWLVINQHPEMSAAEPGFVYDVRRDRFVAFGGSAGRGGALGGTWEFDHQQWRKVAIEGPSPRQGHVMVFDAGRNRVVLFGGMGSGGPGQTPPTYGDTWEYDGTTWKQVSTTGPGARNAAGAAFDSKRGVVVIFGGINADGFLGDTWSWDGTGWRKLSDTGPEPRAMGHLAYDRERDRIVLFGGRKGWPDGDLNDTWEWDGRSWRQVVR